MNEWFEQLHAPDHYYQVAAGDIRQSIEREVTRARDERGRGLRPPGDPWAVLDLIDVAGIPDVGIFIFFRLPQTGEQVHVYLADVRSVADLQRGRAALDAGQDASQLLGQGYDVFDDDFIFAFPAFATHAGDAPTISRAQFFTITQSPEPGPGPGPGPG